MVNDLIDTAGPANCQLRLVNRSDSTLRGHFLTEFDAVAQVLRDRCGVEVDGIVLTPFFAEGGRLTVKDVNWVQEADPLILAAETPYSLDAAFGYRHSRLPEWVEEKTDGRIQASSIASISIELLRLGGPERVAKELSGVHAGQVVIVNAADERDLEVFVLGLDRAEAVDARLWRRCSMWLPGVPPANQAPA